jgi:hypothetical protein
MCEAQGILFEPDFNRFVKVQSFDHRLTSNAGVILLCDAEHKLGFIDSIDLNLLDPRAPRRIRYRIDELIRERAFAMALGYTLLTLIHTGFYSRQDRCNFGFAYAKNASTASIPALKNGRKWPQKPIERSIRHITRTK